MAINLASQIRESFGLAAMSREAKLNLSAHQWKLFQKLSKRFENDKASLKADYAREYKTRVEVARKRLIDKGAAKTKEYKHRLYGHDLFDGKAITRQAQREVRFEHEQDMRQLNSNEYEAKEAFLERFKNSSKHRGKAAQEFDDGSKPQIVRKHLKSR